MSSKNISRIAAGRPVNVAERLDDLEKNVESRILRLEEAIISLKDILIHLNEENESLKTKNDDKVYEPFMKTGEDIVKYLTDEPEPKDEVKVSMKAQNDDMEKAVKLMRKRFGLSPKIGGNAKTKK